MFRFEFTSPSSLLPRDDFFAMTMVIQGNAQLLKKKMPFVDDELDLNPGGMITELFESH